MEKLTHRQRQILDLIRGHIETHGAPPTRAEIANILGFRSANAAEGHLKALARKGAIELVSGASRGIRLTTPRGLPVVDPHVTDAAESIEQYLQLDHRLFNPHADFLLRVKGETAHDAVIADGDLLAVHRTHEARDNQLVVARVGNQLTVKRFRQQGMHQHLFPVNMSPAAAQGEGAIQIEGIGVGVVRTGEL